MLKRAVFLGGTILFLVTFAQAATLTWDYPTGAAVAKFRAYRLQSSECTNTALFQPIGDIPSFSRTLVDNVPLPGLPYCYLVKAVDATGIESPPSNVALFMLQLFTPTNLQVK